MAILTSFIKTIVPIRKHALLEPINHGKSDNPYLNARREWNERYGDYIAAKSNWQKIAFLLLLVVLILTASIAHIATSSRVVPYVVEVDKSGHVSKPLPLDEFARADQRIVRAYLSEYVQNARSITSDPMVQKRWLDKIYASSSQQVASYLNDYYRNNDPFSKSKSALIAVDVNTVLPLSENSWQVDWEETSRGIDGMIFGKIRWRALIGTQIIPPKSQDEMMLNPAGILIQSISWTQQL